MGGLVDIVNLVLNGDTNPLQPILDEIRQDFAQLNATSKAQFDEVMWRDLADEVKDIQTVLDTLKDFVNAQPTALICTIHNVLKPGTILRRQHRAHDGVRVGQCRTGT